MTDILTNGETAIKVKCENINISDFNQICRLCLDTVDLKNIFSVTFQNVPLSEILNEYMFLQVEINDNLPQNICANCVDEAIKLYCIVENCKESQKVLQLVAESGNEPDDIEEEEAIPMFMEENKEIEKNTDVLEDMLLLNQRGFTCEICELTFESLHKLKMHRIMHQAKRIICKICGKLMTHTSFHLHMRIHTKEKPFSCDICSKQFSLKCNMKRHMMTHTGERPYKCDMCGKGFIQSTSLAVHTRTHTGETPFICKYCGKGFKESAKLNQHILRHTLMNGEAKEEVVKKFKCEICNIVFGYLGTLKTHMQKHGEKKYLCSFCGKAFHTKVAMTSHIKVHTGVKPHSCTICMKSFSQLGTLKSHFLTHTGEKPFGCEVCSKTFKQRAHLKYHMKVHSGEKAFVCKLCGKSFALNGTLTVHMRIHSGEKPYICDICGKGFYDSSSMKKHRKVHGDAEELTPL